MRPTQFAVIHPWPGLALACLLTMFVGVMPTNAQAQALQGKWVDESEAAIELHRKTDVTVIVLDRDDKAIHKATVKLVQQRHDFIIGLTLPKGQLPPEDLRDRPVFRALNAIALDRFTDWSSSAQTPAKSSERLVEQWTQAIDPIDLAFGRVISADPARNEDGVALLKTKALRDALQARIGEALKSEPKPNRFDLYADLLFQDMVERKLGMGMVHRMFESAHAIRPDAKLSLRVRDAVSLQYGRVFAAAVQRLEIQQVQIDGVTIEQRFSGQVQAKPLERMLNDYVAELPVPVLFAGLEVGGTTDAAAGLNMETLLRLLFAQPNIKGLYLAGLYDEELVEPNAALLDAQDKPTSAGTVFDALFTKHWHSEVSGTTDERGNVSARVFTGWYSIEAQLPGGQRIQTRAYIPKSDRAKIIVLQLTSAEADDKP